jgi:hypothetical protein
MTSNNRQQSVLSLCVSVAYILFCVQASGVWASSSHSSSTSSTVTCECSGTDMSSFKLCSMDPTPASNTTSWCVVEQQILVQCRSAKYCRCTCSGPADSRFLASLVRACRGIFVLCLVVASHPSSSICKAERLTKYTSCTNTRIYTHTQDAAQEFGSAPVGLSFPPNTGISCIYDPEPGWHPCTLELNFLGPIRLQSDNSTGSSIKAGSIRLTASSLQLDSISTISADAQGFIQRLPSRSKLLGYGGSNAGLGGLPGCDAEDDLFTPQQGDVSRPFEGWDRSDQMWYGYGGCAGGKFDQCACAGVGGGRIRIELTGVASLQGNITASGSAATPPKSANVEHALVDKTSRDCGAGAGGTIFIRASSIESPLPDPLPRIGVAGGKPWLKEAPK